MKTGRGDLETDQSIDVQSLLRLQISKDGNRFLLTMHYCLHYSTGHRTVQHRRSNLGRDGDDGTPEKWRSPAQPSALTNISIRQRQQLVYHDSLGLD